jgi:hypothetical protein
MDVIEPLDRLIVQLDEDISALDMNQGLTIGAKNVLAAVKAYDQTVASGASHSHVVEDASIHATMAIDSCIPSVGAERDSMLATAVSGSSSISVSGYKLICTRSTA